MNLHRSSFSYRPSTHNMLCSCHLQLFSGWYTPNVRQGFVFIVTENRIFCFVTPCNWHRRSLSGIWRSGDRASWYILITKPTTCTNYSNLFLEYNSTCSGQFLCPSSGVFHCTHSNGICHRVLLTACEQDQGGTSSALILLASCVYSEKLLTMDRGTVRNM